MYAKRNQSFDLLRIIACIGVVLIHVNNVYLYSQDPRTVVFNILNIYGSLFRFSVLVFIMISGAYFLDNQKEFTYEKMLKKYIFRIFLALVVFNTIYVFYYYFFVNNGNSIFEAIWLSIKRTIRGDSSGGQLWYLYLCIFLYLITPMLRIFTKHAKRKDIEYFIIFGLIITIVIPTITSYWKFKELNFNDYSTRQMGVVFPFGYVIYYVIGYYMKKYCNKETVSLKTKNIYTWCHWAIINNLSW